jgi:hypothetical protein
MRWAHGGGDVAYACRLSHRGVVHVCGCGQGQLGLALHLVVAKSGHYVQ